jgi:membrane protein YdbS with pleckstrin-like domain
VGFPEKLLNEGEHVVVSTRTHVKVLIGALFVLLVTVFLAAFVVALVRRQVDNSGVQTAVGVVVLVLTAVVLVQWVLRPFVRWYTTTYTFTNRRFVQRQGFIAKSGRTIPLNRISGVDFEIGLVDRLFGCGTLVVSDASEEGRVPLKDIPDVEQVQRRVAEELHRMTVSGRGDDGT